MSERHKEEREKLWESERETQRGGRETLRHVYISIDR